MVKKQQAGEKKNIDCHQSSPGVLHIQYFVKSAHFDADFEKGDF